MVNTTKFIHDNFVESCADGRCIIGVTLFERMFNFIDELFFQWEINSTLAGNGQSFMVRKMDQQNYPIILYKFNNVYVLSITTDYYKKSKNDLMFFILFVQYFMIDLTMAMYNRLNIDPRYAHQGPLYICLLDSLFSIRQKNQFLHIFYHDTRQLFIPVLMTNWANSCYMDSLLTLLLLGDCEVIRAILFKTKKIDFDYNVYGDFINPTMQPVTDSEEKTIAYASELRKQLKQEYKALLGSTQHQQDYQCRIIRNIFYKSNPGMKDANGGYTTYGVTDIYETLTKLFRSLNFYLPVSIYGHNDTTQEYGTYHSVIMQEFMLEDLTTEKIEGEQTIIWDNPPAPFLVFANDNARIFQNYAEGLPQATMEITDENGQKHYAWVNVERWFGEYILNGAYRLVGAMMHHGGGGGGHYNAFLRPFFDRNIWYFYDDIGKNFERVGINCPPQAFWTMQNSRPEMLFYMRVIPQETN